MARHAAQFYKPVLNFHIVLNSVGYLAGMTHGLLLVNDLNSISLSLAITMTVLMTSGILLRYTSSRHTKVFNRLLHGQFVLLLLLIALITLHVLTGDDWWSYKHENRICKKILEIFFFYLNHRIMIGQCTFLNTFSIVLW